jgi:hypothetical protein
MSNRKRNRPVPQTDAERAARRQRKAGRLEAGTVRGGGCNTHATGSTADRKRRDGERHMSRDRAKRQRKGRGDD